MPKVALKLKPLKRYFEERPADGHFASPNWAKLEPIDLDWREAWIEAFLARNKTAIPKCLGANTSQTVQRQVADMDLVFVDSISCVVTVVELKKQGGSHAKAAVCQLARNFDKARRVVREAHRGFSIRAVACGCWGDGQLDKARKTNAWAHLKKAKAAPTFIVYSGAQSNGSEYFVLNKGRSLFPNKGKRVADDRFEELKSRTLEVKKALPSGLDVVAYRIGKRAVIRFTADAELRSLYLNSEAGKRHRNPLLATFFDVKKTLERRPSVCTQFRIEQRLELLVQPKFTYIGEEYSRLHSILKKLEKFAR